MTNGILTSKAGSKTILNVLLTKEGQSWKNCCSECLQTDYQDELSPVFVTIVLFSGCYFHPCKSEVWEDGILLVYHLLFKNNQLKMSLFLKTYPSRSNEDIFGIIFSFLWIFSKCWTFWLTIFLQNLVCEFINRPLAFQWAQIA